MSIVECTVAKERAVFIIQVSESLACFIMIFALVNLSIIIAVKCFLFIELVQNFSLETRNVINSLSYQLIRFFGQHTSYYSRCCYGTLKNHYGAKVKYKLNKGNVARI